MTAGQKLDSLRVIPAGLLLRAAVAHRHAVAPHNCLAFDSKSDDLLTAEQVAVVLKIRPKEVYTLPLATVRLSARRLRWTRSSLDQFISAHAERR